jgi:DNA polymerase-3 subunit gamma/tau
MVTDTPASYIAAPKITEAPKIPVAEPVKPAATPTPVIAEDRPKPAFIPNSGATSSIKIPSLKDIGSTAETALDEEDPYEKGEGRQDFSFDDFLKHWHAFAARVKAEGKMNLFTIFSSEAPKMLRPYVFEVVVENKILDQEFRDDKPQLMNYLRKSLNNYDIEVNTRIDEQVRVKRPYTSQEKYQYMATKNPKLAELRQRFNLDFD